MIKLHGGLFEVIIHWKFNLRRDWPAVQAVILAVLFVTPASTFANTQVRDTIFEGYWAASNLTSVVEIRECDDSLCAEIAWMWDVNIEGRKMLDVKNAAQDKQSMPLVGRALFSKFTQDGDTWRGRIYNPEDGRTYRATVEVHSANILKLRGCWGPFCLTRYWRRLRSIQLPTESILESRK